MSFKDLVPWDRDSKSIPVHREGVHPFHNLYREMDSMFDRFFGDFDLDIRDRWEGYSPHIDVVENDKDIRVSAELPGMDEKDIDVTLTKDTLTLKGEKKEEKEEKGKDYYRKERSYGSFSRTIPLHSEIKTDKVKAEFKKGVLTINLPKTEEAQKEVKKITVHSN